MPIVIAELMEKSKTVKTSYLWQILDSLAEIQIENSYSGTDDHGPDSQLVKTGLRLLKSVWSSIFYSGFYLCLV